MAAPETPWERPPDPVIAAGATFEGLLYLPASGRIDGVMEGTVVAASVVWIGSGGRVRGHIAAGEVVVEGAVDGEVRASRKIELRRSARVTAQLASPRLVLAEGSFFEGRCETQVGEDGAVPEPSAACTPACETP